MASNQLRTKTKSNHWTYGRLVDRLVELGFRNVRTDRDCIALDHESGAKLLLPSFRRETPLDILHRTMAEVTLSSYHLGTLEPTPADAERSKRIKKLASKIDDLRNELKSLGMSEPAQILAEAREKLQLA